jgi:hypothetical protein
METPQGKRPAAGSLCATRTDRRSVQPVAAPGDPERGRARATASWERESGGRPRGSVSAGLAGAAVARKAGERL